MRAESCCAYPTSFAPSVSQQEHFYPSFYPPGLPVVPAVPVFGEFLTQPIWGVSSGMWELCGCSTPVHSRGSIPAGLARTMWGQDPRALRAGLCPFTSCCFGSQGSGVAQQQHHHPRDNKTGNRREEFLSVCLQTPCFSPDICTDPWFCLLNC